MSTHPWQDLAAPYALDVLEGEERASFEAHLAECPDCQREVEELREVAGLLAHAAPAVSPPPRLRQRILAEARQVRPISGRPQAPAREESPPPRQEERRDDRFGGGSRRGGAGGWLPWLAAAASLALAVISGLAYWNERGERLALEQRYEEARTEVAGRDSLLATLLGPRVQTATLAATGEPPSMRLFWNREQGVVVLAAYDLPPAAAGRTYQLWGIAEGEAPVSLGTDPDGRATVTLSVPPGLALDLSAVTEEPAGGSPQPTTTPFLVGPWRPSE